MREDLFGDLFDKEEYYWWHVAKREMVLSLARAAAPANGARPPIGVDLGCGAGYTTKVFDQAWRMVGADVSPEALAFCKNRQLTRLCRVDMTNFALPFKTASVDLVLALDVIEHVADDVHALQECLRILKPGGALVVTVPAFMALWSPWDEILGHKRRYTERGLLDALARAGFSARRSGYFFFSIFPAAILFRWIKRLAGGDAENYSSDFIPLPAAVNGLLLRIGRAERWLSTHLKVRFPFGLSVAALAVKD